MHWRLNRHTGVVVHGKEHYFGGSTGITNCPPVRISTILSYKQCTLKPFDLDTKSRNLCQNLSDKSLKCASVCLLGRHLVGAA